MSSSRTGSIEGPKKHAKTGTTWFRIRWLDAYGRRRSESVTTPDRRVAQRRLDTRLREAEEVRVGLRHEVQAGPSLEQIAVRAAAEVLPLRQRPRQQLNTLRLIQLWWGDLLNEPINQIEPGEIQAILASRRLEGAKPATCNRALSALSVMFKAAHTWRYVTANPTTGLRQKEGMKIPRFLTKDEAGRLIRTIPLAVPGHPEWQAFFATLLMTGMRLSEAQHLRWADLDLRHRRVVVRASVDDDDPKSGHHRVLAVNDTLAPLLAKLGPRPGDWLVFRGRRRSGAARRDPTSDRLVGAYKALKRELARADLRGDISPHDLRHTFATMAIESGMGLRDLQAVLGHSTLAQTSRYVHALGHHAEAMHLVTLSTPTPE